MIDDVWESDHLEPFLRGGADCARLVTTRRADVAREAGARLVAVDEMTADEATRVLVSRLERPPEKLADLQKLAARLGEWPLLLKLAAASIAQRVGHGDSLERAIAYVGAALDRYGPTALDRRSAVSRDAAVATTVEASLEVLDMSERERYVSLAVFPEDEVVPLRVVAELWQCDDLDAERTIERLASASLVQLDLATGTINLHDVLRTYLRHRIGDAGLAEANGRLVASWRNLWPPHDYAWRWIGSHLRDAGRGGELKKLLLDFAWIQGKLEATDIYALVREFDYGPQDSQLLSLQETLRLSAHVLAKNKAKLASQLLSRLPEDETPFRASVIEAARADGQPWLRPLWPGLTQGGGPLLRTIEGHAGAVRSIALAADGLRAISASDDRTLKVWDLQSGRELRTLEGHLGAVTAVGLFRDGTRALSASTDQTIKIWDLQGGCELVTLEGHAGEIEAVALAEDRICVSAGADGPLRVWDLENGRELRKLAGHTDRIMAVALTSDGTRAISASLDKTIKVWDLHSGRELRTLEGHRLGVLTVALTPDGTRAFSGGHDWALRVWDVKSGRQLREPEFHSDWVTALALATDTTRLLLGTDDGTLTVWDPRSGRRVHDLEAHTSPVTAVALSSDGVRAISGSADGTLKMWDLRKAHPLGPLQTLRFSTHGLAVRTIMGLWYLVGLLVSHLLGSLWYRLSGCALYPLEGHTKRVTGVALTPDTARAVTVSLDHTLKIWDLRSGSVLRSIEAHEYRPMAVGISRDGKRIVSVGSEGQLKLWNLRKARKLRTIEHRFRELAVNADATRAVAAFRNEPLKVWDLQSGQQLCVLENPGEVVALAVNADGTRAVSAASDKTIKVWDLQSGCELRTLDGHADSITAIALTDDGARAVSASADKTLKVWDLESGQALRTLHGHASAVVAVALSPDGARAVSGSDDRTLAVWDVDNGELLASFGADTPVTACAIASDRRTVIAGDDEGRVHFLRLENVP